MHITIIIVGRILWSDWTYFILFKHSGSEQVGLAFISKFEKIFAVIMLHKKIGFQDQRAVLSIVFENIIIIITSVIPLGNIGLNRTASPSALCHKMQLLRRPPASLCGFQCKACLALSPAGLRKVRRSSSIFISYHRPSAKIF